MWGLSYWAVPIFSAVVWLAMLISMLVWWTANGSPYFASMDRTQTIAYISDIGAQELKPLFITMGTVSVVTFDIAFILERWLRHTGKLTPNTSIWQKIYSWLSIIFAIIGGAGLILLTIFDTLRHPTLHNVFLAFFIGGYVISAVFICWEYQRLGIHFREHSVLRYSFWVKLFFILLEVALAVAFGVCGRQHKYNAAAVLEWIIAFVYFFYVLSFFMDFMPAVRSKHHQSYQTEMDVAVAEEGVRDNAVNGDRYYSGPAQPAVPANTYNNGYVKPENEAPLTSRNF